MNVGSRSFASPWSVGARRPASGGKRGAGDLVDLAEQRQVFLGALFAAADLRLFLDDRGNPAPAAAGPPGRVVLLVGPEGGFSDAERRRLAAHARPWVLGGHVLWAETAVLAGLAAVHMTWGISGTPGNAPKEGE
jgi:16S rRNA (uracil1498-N3)-methyltransferase